MYKQDNPVNNYKNVAHAFFLSLAITIAEPSTVLPLIIEHFSDSAIVVGLFVSLLRGGAILTQLYAAFHAQSYQKVLPYLKKVFFFRWFSWFIIGLGIMFIGDTNKLLTLFIIGFGLFGFSLSAGFGAIYFKELQAKLFSKTYRGKTMANRQVAGSIASIISGGVAGYVLGNFEAPLNYAYLFIVSSFIMGIGFFTFATINDEPAKKNVQQKEKHFGLFIQNAFAIFQEDKRLQQQTFAIFLSFASYLAIPFVILEAKNSIALTGWILGGFIMVQMVGSIIGSSFLWRRISNYEKMLILSFSFMIVAFIVALFATNGYIYAIVFFLYGIALDGFSNSGMNLIIEIAPEEKRPIYTAIQTNLSSLGLFFPILGGFLLKIFASYALIYSLSIFLLFIGLIVSIKLQRR
ncbi:Permease of the major facilitator superfamily [hydrothermal vent metagenome]|uniref:Permease of the major facilitator superfamily n=1 Tax=hydrothermal vent metagenome TaxID=652676 RepID=A0A1W1D5A7_9ZZZZ